MNVLGYDPMSLVTGKAVSFPGVTTGTVATDSGFSSEHIQRIMERHREIGKMFRECEFGRKLEKAASARARGHKDMVIDLGDEEHHQTQNEKSWLGHQKSRK